jgi:hypothetical protein
VQLVLKVRVSADTPELAPGAPLVGRRVAVAARPVRREWAGETHGSVRGGL